MTVTVMLIHLPSLTATFIVKLSLPEVSPIASQRDELRLAFSQSIPSCVHWFGRGQQNCSPRLHWTDRIAHRHRSLNYRRKLLARRTRSASISLRNCLTI